MTGAEIRALSRLLDRLDYYHLLRVDRDAPLPRIREAYRQARRRFDPDAHLGSEPGLRASVDRVARRITEAWVTLRSPERRASYDRGLEQGRLRLTAGGSGQVRHEESGAQGRTPSGRRLFAMARAEERAGNLARAISHLRMALTFERDHEGFRRELTALEAARDRQPGR